MTIKSSSLYLFLNGSSYKNLVHGIEYRSYSDLQLLFEECFDMLNILTEFKGK